MKDYAVYSIGSTQSFCCSVMCRLCVPRALFPNSCQFSIFSFNFSDDGSSLDNINENYEPVNWTPEDGFGTTNMTKIYPRPAAGNFSI